MFLKDMKNILVSDLMTREPITISPDTNLLECAKLMVRKRVGCLLIVKKKRLVGIISKKDILWALVKKTKEDLSKIHAIEISPRKIATIRPDATVEEAMNKMKKLKFQKLPVIQNNEFIGLITSRDILNFHPEFYKELDEIDIIREESEKLKRINARKKEVVEGVCEECGNFDFLSSVNGVMMCESCRNSV